MHLVEAAAHDGVRTERLGVPLTTRQINYHDNGTYETANWLLKM